MNKETKINNPQSFGFTYGYTAGEPWLRNSHGDYKVIDDKTLELLRSYATGKNISDSHEEIISSLKDQDFLTNSAVEEVQEPEDVSFWPQIHLFIILSIVGLWIAFNGVQSELFGSFSLLEYALIGAIFIVTVIFHEGAHYWFASKHFDPSISIKRINHIFVVVATDTHDAQFLPRNRRLRISIVGPVTDYSFAIAFYILGLYFSIDLFLGAAVLVATRGVISSNPLLQSDGYWILTDLTERLNIRKRGLSDIRNLEPTLNALYVIVSYAFILIVIFSLIARFL